MISQARWMLSVSVISAAFAIPALAQGVGAGSPTNTTHQFSTIPEGGWAVGSVGEPFQVSLDPNGPRWTKTLMSPPPGGPAGPGILHIHEWIEIVPPPPGVPVLPWEDWHEEFVTPGWEWVDFGTNIFFSGDPTMQSVPGLSFTMMGGGLWFDFDPIAPGTPQMPVVIEIWKSFQWNEAVGGPYMPGPIILEEYPTPAPAGTVLAAIGAGLLAIRRRRS